jgi:hypothetical protein
MARCPSVMTLTGTTLIVITLVYLWLARRRVQAGYMDLGELINVASGMTAPQAGAGATPAQLLQPAVTGNVANESLRKVLIYAENNPNDLSKFLNFLKENFFAPDARFADPTPTSGLVGRYRNVFREKVITEASASSNI